MLSGETLEYGRDMMAALLGVDRLYRRESGDEDGLAVLNLDTANAFPAQLFATYRDARSRVEELRSRAATLPEPDRRAYYDEACGSTIAFVHWREAGLGFADQLTQFLHVPAEPASDLELDDLKTQARSLLTAMGYPGDLAAQCAGWEGRHRVPVAEVPTVLEQYLSEAWDRTVGQVASIPAEKSDGMRVMAVSGVAFNARCNYLERLIEINTDPILTRPGLKHLAVHEGYPGHYLQFKLRETGVRHSRSPADVLLSCVNTASSSVFEGIADAGMVMADLIENDDDRIQAILTRYRSGIGTGAAWRLHGLGWDEGRVADWLRRMALTGGDGWVANRLAFIKAPARAVLIWSYWWGEPIVTAAWRRVPPSRRAEFVDFLYGRMHSNTSVAMFA